MCRNKAGGGRRCKRHQGEYRKSYDRAMYAAHISEVSFAPLLKEITLPTSPPPVVKVPFSEEISWSTVTEAVENARVLLADPRPRITKNDDGEWVVTEHGWAVEAAVTHAGELVKKAIDLNAEEDVLRIVTEAQEREDPSDDYEFTIERDRLINEASTWGEKYEEMVCPVELQRDRYNTARQLDVDSEETRITSEQLMKMYEEQEQYSTAQMKAEHELDLMVSDYRKVEKNIMWARKAATTRVLSRIRPLGLEGEQEIILHEITDESMKEVVRPAVRHFPREWVQSSDECPIPLTVANTIYRAGYSHSATVITYDSGNKLITDDCDPADGEPVAVLVLNTTPAMGKTVEGIATHEFAHRCERTYTPNGSPILFELQETFLQRRTGGGPGKTTADREPLVPYEGKEEEVIRPDNFAHVYMGKEYKWESREVLSTGMEALWSGEFGGMRGNGNYHTDEDMHAFVLGVLATA